MSNPSSDAQVKSIYTDELMKKLFPKKEIRALVLRIRAEHLKLRLEYLTSQFWYPNWEDKISYLEEPLKILRIHLDISEETMAEVFGVSIDDYKIIETVFPVFNQYVLIKLGTMFNLSYRSLKGITQHTIGRRSIHSKLINDESLTTITKNYYGWESSIVYEGSVVGSCNMFIFEHQGKTVTLAHRILDEILSL